MARDPERLRISSVLGLWALATRAALTDETKTGWGATLTLLCAVFFLFVGRSQMLWLGRSHAEWWAVACRAEVAAFVALSGPQRWCVPVFVFVAVFKASRHTEMCDGGALWRAAPLALLLHPRRWYSLDVVGVALLLSARHRDHGSMHTEDEYHAHHERFVAADVLACFVLATAGAPLATRAALFVGTAVLAGAVHAKYPRSKIGFWDLANRRERPHMPVPFRGVNDS